MYEHPFPYLLGVLLEWIDKVPRVKTLPEPKHRPRWLTREEAGRLLAELPEHLASMVRFSLATGLRQRNVTELEWNQVDLDRQCAWIYADQSKSGHDMPCLSTPTR